MVLTNAELEVLEKKYFNIIYNILDNNIGRFINEIYSQNNILDTPSNDKTNSIETAAENIMNAMIARRLDWGVASMPAASDSCYECGDAIVHIDAKTILTSDGDSRLKSNRIALRQNQTSFDYNHPYKVTKGDGKEFVWKPKLHRYEKHKLFGEIPNLTYILRVNYSTESLVEDISLICIPNGQFYDTHKSILGGVKVYPKNEKLDNIRFKIAELLTIDAWREKIIYLKH